MSEDGAVSKYGALPGARVRRFPATAGLRCLALAVLAGCLCAVTISAMTLGTTPVSARDVVATLFAFDGSREHLIVATVRLPRALAALLAGAALAVAGAIMQAVTGNPLASPSLLGVNAGAAFAVVVSISLLGVGSSGVLVWFAFAGAAVAAATVYVFAASGPARATPVKLVLAGAVVTAFLTSLTASILIYDRSTLDIVRLWTAGSLAGRTMQQVVTLAPYIGVGLAASIVVRGHMTTLSLGAETARSVGQSQGLWRSISVVIVVLLAGGAVALAGPIGFVGLVVPHTVRFLAGVDYRWIVPFSALGGALLVVVADTAGRVLFAHHSFPVGVTMAVIGAPFFIVLARARAGGRP